MYKIQIPKLNSSQINELLSQFNYVKVHLKSGKINSILSKIFLPKNQSELLNYINKSNSDLVKIKNKNNFLIVFNTDRYRIIPFINFNNKKHLIF